VDKGEYVECSVKDTGIGIAEEDLPKVFSKFQQFGKGDDAGEGGTGLGLSISKGIVELHGGRIWVESKINEGTKFTFTLPKYADKKVIYDTISNKISTIWQECDKFSVFILRLDNYQEIKDKFSESKTQKILSQVVELLERIIGYAGVVNLKDERDIVVLAEINEDDILVMAHRLKRLIKRLSLEENFRIKFSYGYAVYPGDKSVAEELFKQAEKNMISEEQERLQKNIMIVDDESEVVESVKQILHKAGYNNFTSANDGEQTLELIKKKVPDLIILDMKMPHMSGYEVIGRLKEDTATKDIPILIMTGYKVEIERLSEYIKKKAIPVLSKPFDEDQLIKLVDYLL
jgi:diguanylate cyclase (GGDEF)-like protein